MAYPIDHPSNRPAIAAQRLLQYEASGKADVKWYETAAKVTEVTAGIVLFVLSSLMLFKYGVSIWAVLGVGLGGGLISSLIIGGFNHHAMVRKEQHATDELYLKLLLSQGTPHLLSDLPVVDKRVYTHVRNAEALRNQSPASPRAAKRNLDALGVDFTPEASYHFAERAYPAMTRLDPYRQYQQALNAATKEQRPHIVKQLQALATERPKTYADAAKPVPQEPQLSDNLSLAQHCLQEQQKYISDKIKSGQEDFFKQQNITPEQYRRNLLNMINYNQEQINELGRNAKKGYAITEDQLELARLQLDPDPCVHKNAEIIQYKKHQDTKIQLLIIDLKEREYYKIEELEAKVHTAESIADKKALISELEGVLSGYLDKIYEKLQKSISELKKFTVIQHVQVLKDNQNFRTAYLSALHAEQTYIIAPLLNGYTLETISQEVFEEIIAGKALELVALKEFEEMGKRYKPDLVCFNDEIEALSKDCMILHGLNKFDEACANLRFQIWTQKRGWLRRFGRGFINSFKASKTDEFKTHGIDPAFQERIHTLMKQHDKSAWRTRMFTIIAIDLVAMAALSIPCIFIQSPYLWTGMFLGGFAVQYVSYKLNQRITRRSNAIQLLRYAEYLKKHQLRPTPGVDLKGRAARLALDGYEMTGARLALGQKPQLLIGEGVDIKDEEFEAYKNYLQAQALKEQAILNRSKNLQILFEKSQLALESQ